MTTTDARLAAPPETLDDDPPVTAVMTRSVVALDPEARLPTALHAMNTAGVRHLPVVERGRLLGVLVEADLVRHLAEGPRPFCTALATTARRLCRSVAELPPTARVSAAARLMSADVTDAVLVTEDRRILGIVTATDLVHLLADRDARRAG
jgi:CBS domain-containing protein